MECTACTAAGRWPSSAGRAVALTPSAIGEAPGGAGCHGSASLVPEEVGALGSSQAASSDATSLASSLFFRASLNCFCLHDLS